MFWPHGPTKLPLLIHRVPLYIHHWSLKPLVFGRHLPRWIQALEGKFHDPSKETF